MDQEYQVCGNGCEATCDDLFLNKDCKKTCVEGCNCPPGQVLNATNVCVPKSHCPCDYNGRKYDVESTVTMRKKGRAQYWLVNTLKHFWPILGQRKTSLVIFL